MIAVEAAVAGGDKLCEPEVAAGAGAAGGARERRAAGRAAPVRALGEAVQHRQERHLIHGLDLPGQHPKP